MTGCFTKLKRLFLIATVEAFRISIVQTLLWQRKCEAVNEMKLLQYIAEQVIANKTLMTNWIVKLWSS